VSWLPATGFEDAPDHIAAALQDMVNKNWLQMSKLPDGELFYSRGAAFPDRSAHPRRC